MPDVLPTINNEPAQGIQALLDTTYLWNPDVANDLIEQINALLEKLNGVTGSIPPYSELEAPVKQYQPCYNGDNVYVAAADIETLPTTFDPAQWILIATKAPVLQAGAGIDINGNEISVEQQVLSDAAAGATAVQPEDLGTAAYASTSDFATAAQGGKADTAVQPADLAAVATSGNYTDLSNKPAIDGVTLTSQTTKADIGLAGVYKYKGSVATYADLANVQNPVVGDVYNVEDTGDNYAWNGTEWDQLGGTFVPPVTSVNSKTGAVVLTSTDVGAIPQYSDMPEPNRSGDIVQYIGDTTPNYTNGFFYKSDEVTSYSAEQTIGQNVTEIVVDRNAFVNFLENHPSLSVPLTVTMTNVYEPETMSITYGDGTDLTVTCVAATFSAKLVNTFINGYNDLNHADLVFARTQDDTWDVSGSFQRHSMNYPEPVQVSETNINLSDYGITIDSGTVKQGDTISVGVDGYWVGYDCGDGVTGYLDFGILYKGYFETGDVIIVSEGLGLGWNRIDVQTVGLVNTATAEYSLGILGSATQSNSLAVGDGAVADGQLSTVVGNGAYVNATGGTAVGSESGASGYMASAYGRNAVASGEGSIQLGEGVNSESYSFAVGGRVNNTQKEYKLLDINSGLIPAERLANTFYATQGYVLTLDVNGNAVWQARGGVSSVNSKTGTVVLSAEDVGATPQYSTMPTADSTNVGGIVQFTGATDATYTHGYIYECTGATTPASTSETVSSSTMSNVTVNVATFVSGLDSISEGDPETYSAIVDDILDGTSSFICSYMDDGGGDVTWCLLLGPYTMVYGSLAGVGITYSGAPAEGDTITVDYTPESTTYAWQQTDVQPQGDSLPSQTGNSGKFLTTNGTDASWGDIVKQHTIMYDGGDLPRPNQGFVDVLTFAGTKSGSTIYPAKIQLHDSGMVLWGSSSNFAVTITGNLIGSGTIGRNVYGVVQSWQKIFVNNISSGAKDISVPNTSGTMAVIQVNTTITLTAAGWSSNSQTVTVNGVTSTSVVFVAPDPADTTDYVSAGILCTSQTTNSLTFTATTTPTSDIDVNIVCL